MNLQARLKNLLDLMQLQVAAEALPSLIWYLQEMLRWNRRINLTAISDPEEALEKHLLDSLTVLPLLQGRETLLDMGSGAGLPGIPLKLARPGLNVLSLDSVRKKIVFQQHVARSLSLSGFEALPGRIETLFLQQHNYRGHFQVVTARALAALPQLIALASPFLAPSGRLIAMKGPEGEREWTRIGPVAEHHGLMCEKAIPWRLPLFGAQRTLLVLRRIDS
jgi:16S rRNA (guanine527-N7)-methyltransferase